MCFRFQVSDKGETTPVSLPKPPPLLVPFTQNHPKLGPKNLVYAVGFRSKNFRLLVTRRGLFQCKGDILVASCRFRILVQGNSVTELDSLSNLKQLTATLQRR